MAMFNSYVSLPEGTLHKYDFEDFTNNNELDKTPEMRFEHVKLL